MHGVVPYAQGKPFSEGLLEITDLHKENFRGGLTKMGVLKEEFLPRLKELLAKHEKWMRFPGHEHLIPVSATYYRVECLTQFCNEYTL